jgi:hypothetical protein
MGFLLTIGMKISHTDEAHLMPRLQAFWDRTAKALCGPALT